MDRTEFDRVKNFTYEEYCDYLKTKYGKVPAKYGSSKNKKPGYFIHHIAEDKVPSLSHPEQKKQYPEYQVPELLVYCDYLEHLLLHIMIGRISDPAKHLGLNGPCQYIIPGLISFYEYGATHPKWDKFYYTIIKNDYDVFKDLLNEYNELVKEIDLVLEHNISLYEQVANSLDTNGKALAELGTGLGKTTLALQYVKSHNCRALVICPNNTVKEGWTRNGDWTKPITFAGLAAIYNPDTNSFSKDILNSYGLVIIDEVHHAGYDEDTGKGAAIWGAAIKYVFESGIKVLGLSATPVRTDGIDVGEQYFKDCAFQGFNFETAIERGIVHPLSYITSIYDKDGITSELRDLGWHSGSTDPARMKLEGQLDVALNNIPEVVDILTTHISQHGRKGLVFVQEENDSDEAINILTKAFPNSEIRKLNSHMSEKEIKENRAWFADEKTTEGYLVVINMVSEGAHYPGVNTGIMFRRTDSYVLLTQMLGRFSVLATKPNPNIVVIDLVNNLNRIKYNDRVKDAKKKRLDVDIRRALMKTAAAKSGQIIVKDYTQNFVERMHELKNYVDDSWEDWEIDILRENYTKEGANKTTTILNKLRESHHQRPRSVGSVQCKSNMLGLFSLSRGLIWTHEDDEILKKYYPIEGSSCYKRFKYYDRKAVQQRALKLKIKAPEQKIWSDRDIKLLVKLYPLYGKEVYKHIEGKTKNQCFSKAKALGLKVISPRHVCRGKLKLKQSKKILCVETNMEYDSVAVASQETDVNKGSIYQCLQGRCTTAGGFHWNYVEKGEGNG